jgi:flagellar basal body-associated protein FliL
MAEETEQEGTWSGLKKTIIGVATTLVTAGGVWISTLLGGGDKAEPAQPAAAPVINITNSNQQQQQAAGKTVIIQGGGGAAAKPADKPQPAKPKKEADEFKEKPAQW